MKYLLFALILSISIPLKAQKGKFLSAHVGLQQTSIKNRWDMGSGRISGLGPSFTYLPTYKLAAGFNFYNNSTENIGYRTGLVFYNQGQKYQSRIRVEDGGMVNDSATTTAYGYTSEVRLQYLKVPLILHFGINEENSRVYFTMGFGFQLGLLLRADYEIETDLDPIHNGFSTYSKNDFFRLIEPSLVLTMELMIAIDKDRKNHIIFGFSFENTIGDISPVGDVPREYSSVLQPPFGTLKDERFYNRTERSKFARTKLESNYLKLGFVRKIGK